MRGHGPASFGPLPRAHLSCTPARHSNSASMGEVPCALPATEEHGETSDGGDTSHTRTFSKMLCQYVADKTER